MDQNRDFNHWFIKNRGYFGTKLNGYSNPPVSIYKSILAVMPTATAESCKILDLGCGNGMLLKFLGEFAGKIIPYGVEKIRESHRQAVEEIFPEFRDHFELGDVAGYSFSRGPFQCIIANPFYVEKNKRRTFLRRCMDSLSPGGRLICLIQEDVKKLLCKTRGEGDFASKIEEAYDASGLGMRYSQGGDIAFMIFDKTELNKQQKDY